MIAVGKLFEAADGVESSFISAAKWYEKAAATGNLTAKTELEAIRGYKNE